MKRRGSLHHTELSRMIEQFKPGMYVVATYAPGPADSIRGVVRDVDMKSKKIYVAWNGGPVKQHDADELMPASMPVSEQSEVEGNAARDLVMKTEAEKRLSSKDMHRTVASVMRSFIK